MDLLTVREAARELDVTPLTVRRYIYAGKLISHPTPGGHHRIPRSEIDAYLTGQTAPLPASSALIPDASLRDTLAQMQRDIATLQKQLQVMAHSCSHLASVAQQSGSPHRFPKTPPRSLEVLGPGCPACDQLASMAEDTVRELQLKGVTVHRVKKLDDIVAFGPVLTPALVLEGKLLVSGTVPSLRRLRKLLLSVLS